MHVTYFGANSWLLEWDQRRILIDPWLMGPLIFGNLPWLFKGERSKPITVLPENIDLILLSQGLPDHAHRPTLECFDRAIPVVASPNAGTVARSLGYTTVTPLSPGQQIILLQEFEIRALIGAPIGLQRENGYLLKHLPTNVTLYYEPHGFPAPELQGADPVNVVISPIVSLELPLVGPIIQGSKTALDIAHWLKPQVFLPTAVGDDNVTYAGLLDRLLSFKGSVATLRSRLAQAQLATQVITPKSEERLELPLG